MTENYTILRKSKDIKGKYVCCLTTGDVIYFESVSFPYGVGFVTLKLLNEPDYVSIFQNGIAKKFAPNQLLDVKEYEIVLCAEVL